MKRSGTALVALCLSLAWAGGLQAGPLSPKEDKAPAKGHGGGQNTPLTFTEMVHVEMSEATVVAENSHGITVRCGFGGFGNEEMPDGFTIEIPNPPKDKFLEVHYDTGKLVRAQTFSELFRKYKEIDKDGVLKGNSLVGNTLGLVSYWADPVDPPSARSRFRRLQIFTPYHFNVRPPQPPALYKAKGKYNFENVTVLVDSNAELVVRAEKGTGPDGKALDLPPYLELPVQNREGCIAVSLPNGKWQSVGSFDSLRFAAFSNRDIVALPQAGLLGCVFKSIELDLHELPKAGSTLNYYMTVVLPGKSGAESKGAAAVGTRK